MKESHKTTIRKGFLASVLLCFCIPLISITPVSGKLLYECDGPTHLIQVIVTQEKESPPTYSYVLKNRLKLSVIAFELGDSDDEEMEVMAENIPTTITSPTGWAGQTNFKDESIYMNISWRTYDLASMIPPGNSLGHFRVTLPEPSQKKVPLYNLFGNLSKPLDMNKAPFSVYLEDGACVWGRVQEEK